MSISKVENAKEWDDFLLKQKTQTGLPAQAGIFLQSWDWGEFQAQLGRKVWRLGITRTITRKDTDMKRMEHGLEAVCLVVKMELPMGRSYLYSPRGPVLADELGIMNQESWDCLVGYVKDVAKKEKAIFWRIEPPQSLKPKPYTLKPTPSVQPKQTLVLDLSKEREILLSEMHEKTRYNIRLAERKGVKIKTGQFEEFWKLLKKTSRRDRFSTHPRSYYKKMLAVLGKEGVMRVRLHTAYFENRAVAAAIVGYFGDTATYLHGASSYEDRALMAPYALHWDIINDAKKDGYLFYDFWGVDEKRWPGVTRFKLGFGGRVVDYPGAFDLPLSRFWYKVYRLGRRIL